jgi:hypothetical protein
MIDPTEGTSTLHNAGKEPIRQFVIYAEHKVGWLNDFVSLLNDENIDILAISVLDTTDSAVIRLISNYPKDLARLLKSLSISFTERMVFAVELEKDDSMQILTKALLRAEINIHYIYSFLHQPNGKPIVAIAVEEQDTALDVLRTYQLKVMSQDELNR